MRPLFAIARLITGFVLRRPLILASLVGLCVHSTYMWAVAFLMSFPAESVIFEFVRMRQATKTSLRASSELRAIFEGRTAHCLRELSEQEVSQYVSGDLELELNMKRRGFIKKAVQARRREAGLPEHYQSVRMYVPADNGTMPFLAQHSAFVTPLNSSHILLNIEPNQSDILDRFKILHELAHSTPIGIFIAAERQVMPVRVVILAFVIACSAFSSWVAIATLLIGSALIGAIAFRGNSYCETYADVRALAAMSRSDALEVAETLLDVWNTDQDMLLAMSEAGTDSELLTYRQGVEREERMVRMKLARQVLERGKILSKSWMPPEYGSPAGFIFYALVVFSVITARFDADIYARLLGILVLTAIFQPVHLSRIYRRAYNSEFALERRFADLATPVDSPQS